MKNGWILLLLLSFLSGCAFQQNITRAIANESSPLYFNGKNFSLVAGQGFIGLHAPDCKVLISTANALALWQHQSIAPECNCREGSCDLEISGFLPQWLREKLGKTELKPNCFNTALVGAGLDNSFHFVRFFEFSKILRASCTPTRAPLPGDLGVVNQKGQGLSPVHAFIYFTPEFGFEKPGANPEEPWQFMNPARIMGSPSPFSVDSFELQYFHCRRDS